MFKVVKIIDKNVNIVAPVWVFESDQCGCKINWKFKNCIVELSIISINSVISCRYWKNKLILMKMRERESETDSTLQFLLWIWEERWRQLSHVITVNSMWKTKPVTISFMLYALMLTDKYVHRNCVCMYKLFFAWCPFIEFLLHFSLSSVSTAESNCFKTTVT